MSLELSPTGMAWYIYSIKHSFPPKVFPIKLSAGNGSWPRLTPQLWAGIAWQTGSWPSQMHAGAIRPLDTAAFRSARQEQVRFISLLALFKMCSHRSDSDY